MITRGIEQPFPSSLPPPPSTPEQPICIKCFPPPSFPSSQSPPSPKRPLFCVPAVVEERRSWESGEPWRRLKRRRRDGEAECFYDEQVAIKLPAAVSSWQLASRLEELIGRDPLGSQRPALIMGHLWGTSILTLEDLPRARASIRAGAKVDGPLIFARLLRCTLRRRRW